MPYPFFSTLSIPCVPFIFVDLCHGHSYFQRVLFLEICNLVLELYSRAFFKENFFEALLDLTLDPVPNVRLRLCPFFPRLKAIIRLPAERSLLQQLETSVRRLLGSERDRDVRAALEKAVMELDRVQVLMESVSVLLVIMYVIIMHFCFMKLCFDWCRREAALMKMKLI